MRAKMRHFQSAVRPGLVGICAALAIASSNFSRADDVGYTHDDPKKAIATAEAEAAKTNKRVIIDFGGNWCGDCKALEAYMHKPENQGLLSANYVLVKVNVGDDGITQNFDLAQHYGIPLKGVPSLAVVDPQDHVIYSQANKEFADMRHMDPSSVHEFLEQWKPASSNGR